MIKSIFVVLMSVYVSVALAEECEPAADAAARMADTSNCDYTKTGLNGVLHKAFSNNAEVSSSAKSSEKPAIEKAGTEKIDIKRDASAITKEFTQTGEFNSPAQLQFVSFTLIEKAIHTCSNGFVIENERVLPVSNASMKLELVYRCL